MRRVVLALAMGLAAPAQAADNLLQRLAGDWIGRGTYLQSPNANPELVYCRISNELADGGMTLEQNGRCAVASNSAGLEITIIALGGGQYSGSGNGIGLGARGQATISGTATGDRLDLTAELFDTATNRIETATTTIELAVDGYRVRVRRTEVVSGVTYMASEIVFTPN